MSRKRLRLSYDIQIDLTSKKSTNLINTAPSVVPLVNANFIFVSTTHLIKNPRHYRLFSLIGPQSEYTSCRISHDNLKDKIDGSFVADASLSEQRMQVDFKQLKKRFFLFGGLIAG
jgi:hypothetical protein